MSNKDVDQYLFTHFVALKTMVFETEFDSFIEDIGHKKCFCEIVIARKWK